MKFDVVIVGTGVVGAMLAGNLSRSRPAGVYSAGAAQQLAQVKDTITVKLEVME